MTSLAILSSLSDNDEEAQAEYDRQQAIAAIEDQKENNSGEAG